MSKQLNKISKYLSFILRHKPDAISLKLDINGWADIDELISKTTDFKLTKELLQKVVDADKKQRYSIKVDKIRANQGHSIDIDLNLAPQKPPIVLYHGTATRFHKSIITEGLKSQNRQFVHLSKDLVTAKAVGMRHGKPIILEIDSLKMYNDGFKFYISENGVWLTDYVPTKYIKS